MNNKQIKIEYTERPKLKDTITNKIYKILTNRYTIVGDVSDGIRGFIISYDDMEKTAEDIYEFFN